MRVIDKTEFDFYILQKWKICRKFFSLIIWLNKLSWKLCLFILKFHLLLVSIISINGQTKIDTSTSYIHNKSASFQSQALQSIMAFVGMKNNIEKDLIKGKFSQEAASIPNSIQKRFDLRMHKKNGRNIWTLKPKQNVSEKIILYIHGGAYIYNISKYHWKLIE